MGRGTGNREWGTENSKTLFQFWVERERGMGDGKRGIVKRFKLLSECYSTTKMAQDKAKNRSQM